MEGLREDLPALGDADGLDVGLAPLDDRLGPESRSACVLSDSVSKTGQKCAYFGA